MTTTDTFCRALFGGAPADTFTLMWTLPDRRSTFIPAAALDALASHITSAAATCDVYIGCGLRARDHGLQILIMGLTAMLVAAVSDSVYALAAGRAGRALSAKRVRLLSRVSGGFLIGGGLWLAFSRR